MLKGRTSGLWVSLASSASAGMQELHPWLVNSSTTTGRLAGAPAAAGTARTQQISAQNAARATEEPVMAGTIESASRPLQSLRLEPSEMPAIPPVPAPKGRKVQEKCSEERGAAPVGAGARLPGEFRGIRGERAPWPIATPRICSPAERLISKSRQKRPCRPNGRSWPKHVRANGACGGLRCLMESSSAADGNAFARTNG